MTPTQLAAAYAGGSHDEQADFNDACDSKIYPSSGNGESDGVTWSETHQGYSVEEKEAFELALLTHGLSVRHPCD